MAKKKKSAQQHRNWKLFSLYLLPEDMKRVDACAKKFDMNRQNVLREYIDAGLKKDMGKGLSSVEAERGRPSK
jgi:hypothetical protein